MPIIDLTDRAAIVTGGARGIGRAIVQLLAEAGADVLIGDLRRSVANDAAAEISASTGRRIEVFEVDVSNFEQVQALRDEALRLFGKIDILINNAGWDRLTPFMKTTPDLWDRIIGINYKGTIHTTYAVIPTMAEQKSGVIVNVSSDSARVGSFGEAIYAGSKAAIIAFSKTIAREHARDNIRVNVVCPGLAETPLVDEMNHEELGAKILNAIRGQIPLRRFAQPEEIAPMIVFLASDGARYMTGQVVSVNGGLTMVG